MLRKAACIMADASAHELQHSYKDVDVSYIHIHMSRMKVPVLWYASHFLSGIFSHRKQRESSKFVSFSNLSVYKWLWGRGETKHISVFQSLESPFLRRTMFRCVGLSFVIRIEIDCSCEPCHIVLPSSLICRVSGQQHRTPGKTSTLGRPKEAAAFGFLVKPPHPNGIYVWCKTLGKWGGGSSTTKQWRQRCRQTGLRKGLFTSGASEKFHQCRCLRCDVEGCIKTSWHRDWPEVDSCISFYWRKQRRCRKLTRWV